MALSDGYLRQVTAFLEGGEAELRDHPGRQQPAWLAMLRDLLAELERLRQPPDVSGLMPAARLAQLRDPQWFPGTLDYMPALFKHIDTLEALVRELYGVVADLHADDPGRQALLGRGRAEGRGQVWQLLVEYGTPPTDGAISAVEFEARHGKGGLGDAVRALGPSRPPLPPCEAEREAARLREALRACLERLQWVSWGHGLSPAHFAHAIEAARAALGEGP